MMYPIEDPDTTLMVHEEMVQREMQRNYPEWHRPARSYTHRIRPISGLRNMTSRALIALGTRIAVQTRLQEPARG